MENKFKYYYDCIIEEDETTVRGKHNDHLSFCDEVNKIRELIKSGDQSWKKDEDFLERLIHSKDNGIVNIGLSHIHFSYNNFLKLIIDDSFMLALEEFIVAPSQDTHHSFDLAWVAQQKLISGLQHNVVVINRVAPVCTLEVSTLAHLGQFNYLFNWLMGEKIIPEYPSNADQRWFSRNQFLMKEIKQQFHNELGINKPDDVYLSDFVWYLYDYVKKFTG